MKLPHLSLLAALVATATLRSQACALVADIHAVPRAISADIDGARRAGPGGQNITEFVRCGSHHYFVATTVAHGTELWRTDGTSSGTRLVADIEAGPSSAQPDELACFDLGNGPRLFFWATTVAGGPGVWTSDGTAAGTGRLGTIARGDPRPIPSPFEQVGNVIVFAGRELATGTELWVTDGTVSGTTLLKDFWPGPQSGRPKDMLTDAAGTTCFFAAGDPTIGNELWKTDGTIAGTVLVKDLLPRGSGTPGQFVCHNGTVLFTASGTQGRELWRTDGTAAGTVQIKDIDPGGSSSSPALSSAAAIGTNLYFSARTAAAGSELWRTDGTTAGTTLAADLVPGSSSSHPSALFANSQAILFTASIGAIGGEPYRFDPSTNTATSLGDLMPGRGSSLPRDWAAIAVGRVLFTASSGATGTGRELWVTDGTPAGTRLLRDIEPGPASSAPSWVTPIGNGRVLFTAGLATIGRELWESNGTPTGTRLLLDVEPRVRTDGSFPAMATPARNPHG